MPDPSGKNDAITQATSTRQAWKVSWKGKEARPWVRKAWGSDLPQDWLWRETSLGGSNGSVLTKEGSPL